MFIILFDLMTRMSVASMHAAPPSPLQHIQAALPCPFLPTIPFPDKL